MTQKLFHIAFLFCFLSANLFACPDKILSDGPYILRQGNDSLRIISVYPQNIITDTVVHKSVFNSFWVNNESGDYRFKVTLRDNPQREDSRMPSPHKTFIISDPHSNFESFVDILLEGKVIDSTLTWKYGKGHLMIIGDIFDRGDDATTIYWLIYKLEQEAEADGGKVHSLIGNHENMVLQNNLKYANKKYTELATSLNIRYSDLWSKVSILGEWLRTKNTIQILGNTLFAHAGISDEMRIDLEKANQAISDYIDITKNELSSLPEEVRFLFGSNGPLWYRGLVSKEEKYNPISETDLNKTLNYYKVKRMVIGHTTFKSTTFFFSGKVIAVDSKNKRLGKKHLGYALVMTNDNQWMILD